MSDRSGNHGWRSERKWKILTTEKKVIFTKSRSDQKKVKMNKEEVEKAICNIRESEGSIVASVSYYGHDEIDTFPIEQLCELYPHVMGALLEHHQDIDGISEFLSDFKEVEFKYDIGDVLYYRRKTEHHEDCIVMVEGRTDRTHCLSFQQAVMPKYRVHHVQVDGYEMKDGEHWTKATRLKDGTPLVLGGIGWAADCDVEFIADVIEDPKLQYAMAQGHILWKRLNVKSVGL